MALWWMWLGLMAVGLLVVSYLAWRPLRESWRVADLQRARQQFRVEREQLEAKFFSLAGSSGKPRGLRWVECDFHNDVTYARERKSGDIVALIGVVIRFEAIPGGPMEDVEAVGNLRVGSAVFHYHTSHWHTLGRALFNLNPSEAIHHYAADYEKVGHQPGAIG